MPLCRRISCRYYFGPPGRPVAWTERCAASAGRESAAGSAELVQQRGPVLARLLGGHDLVPLVRVGSRVLQYPGDRVCARVVGRGLAGGGLIASGDQGAWVSPGWGSVRGWEEDWSSEESSTPGTGGGASAAADWSETSPSSPSSMLPSTIARASASWALRSSSTAARTSGSLRSRSITTLPEPLGALPSRSSIARRKASALTAAKAG